MAFSVYLPTYLTAAYHLDKQRRRAAHGGFVVLAVAMRPIGGWLSDRLGPIPVLVAAFGVVAAASPRSSRSSRRCCRSAPSRSSAWPRRSAPATGAVFALVARMVPAERVGAVTGVVGAAGGLGGFFPPLVMGLVYGALGGYTVGFVLLAATAAAAGLFTATVVRRRAEQQAAAGTSTVADPR